VNSVPKTRPEALAQAGGAPAPAFRPAPLPSAASARSSLARCQCMESTSSTPPAPGNRRVVTTGCILSDDVIFRCRGHGTWRYADMPMAMSAQQRQTFCCIVPRASTRSRRGTRCCWMYANCMAFRRIVCRLCVASRGLASATRSTGTEHMV
jgi:hypothetical protein